MTIEKKAVESKYDEQNQQRIYIFTTKDSVWSGKEYFGGRWYPKPNFSFLYAVCNNNGDLLAYTRAILYDSIERELTYDAPYHKGYFYVFEEYNRELIKDFHIPEYMCGHDGIQGSAHWDYESDKGVYHLTLTSRLFGEPQPDDIESFNGLHNQQKHWFRVTDDDNIRTDKGYRSMTLVTTYKWKNTRPTSPNPEVVDFVRQQLIQDKVVKKNSFIRIK